MAARKVNKMCKTMITVTKEVEVNFLIVNANVRYWEDATVNGQEYEEGTLVPCRNGDSWSLTIDLETGIISNWPIGTTADIHFKVCDCGTYQLADADGKIVKEINGYVPSVMCPGGQGYGDYIIMKIDAGGKIENWDIDLDDFEKED